MRIGCPPFLRGFLFFVLVWLCRETATAKDKVFVFYGEVEAVNRAAKTFTLVAEKKHYVFHVNEATKFTQNRFVVGSSYLRPGRAVGVEMKLGPAAEGIATVVNFVAFGGRFSGSGGNDRHFPFPNSVVESVLAATTPDGVPLSAQQVKPLVVSSAWPDETVYLVQNWVLKLGVFLLSVRNDGTVASVEMLQSTGHRGMNFALKESLLKWRFRPGSVKEVRIPAHYSWGNH